MPIAEYGKTVRKEVGAPLLLWDALLAHSRDPDDRERLAREAERQGLNDYSTRFRAPVSDVKWAEDVVAEMRQTNDVITRTMKDYIATGRLAPDNVEGAEDLVPRETRANLGLLIAAELDAPIPSKPDLPCTERSGALLCRGP